MRVLECARAAWRRAITQSAAETIHSHPPVELPMMSSGWVTSLSRPHRRHHQANQPRRGAIPRVCCSPVPHNTQHADTVEQVGCTGDQCTPNPLMRGCTGYQCTPLTVPSRRSSHNQALYSPAVLQPIMQHPLLLMTGAAGSPVSPAAATACLGRSATEAPVACCLLLPCTPLARQKVKRWEQLHLLPAQSPPATPH